MSAMLTTTGIVVCDRFDADVAVAVVAVVAAVAVALLDAATTLL